VSTPAIDVKGLTVHYGDLLALDAVTLQIQPGRVCALVGMNGSGKSTLFKSIIGLVRADRGQVLIHGRPPGVARSSGMAAYVPQREEVDPDFPLSVGEVVMTGRYPKMGWTRRPRQADHAAVQMALARVGLSDLAGRPIGHLSGGQRKRVFVARGVAQGASVLLLDEPFAGVDQHSQRAITQVLRELANDGVAIMIATHDLDSLPELADDAVLLMRTVLMHDVPVQVLRPENLARAFGLPGPPEHER